MSQNTGPSPQTVAMINVTWIVGLIIWLIYFVGSGAADRLYYKYHPDKAPAPAVTTPPAPAVTTPSAPVVTHSVSPPVSAVTPPKSVAPVPAVSADWDTPEEDERRRASKQFHGGWFHMHPVTTEIMSMPVFLLLWFIVTTNNYMFGQTNASNGIVYRSMFILPGPPNVGVATFLTILVSLIYLVWRIASPSGWHAFWVMFGGFIDGLLH